MKHFYPFILPFLLLPAVSCSSKGGDGGKEAYSEKRARMETEAQGRLATARQQLADGEVAAAKATVGKMRKDCYLALDARAAGILLMDSIDLKNAQLELARVDSLLRAGGHAVGQADFDEACRKVQFYERKIQFDKKK